MTKPGTEAEKRRKVKQKRHCRTARCRQSQHHVHRGQSLRQKHHVPHSKLHTMNASHPHYLWRESAKATSHLRLIHRRSALQGTAKAQGYALCLSPEVHRAKKEHLDNCFAHVTRLPSRGFRHCAITCPWKPMWTSPNLHFCCVQDHKKAASRTAKRANAQGGLKLNDGLPGRVGLEFI